MTTIVSAAFVRSFTSQNRRLGSILINWVNLQDSTKQMCILDRHQRLNNIVRLASSSSDANDNEKNKKKKKAKVEFDFDEESLTAAFASLDPPAGSYKVSDREMSDLQRLDEIELARLNDPTNAGAFESDDKDFEDEDFSIEYLDDNDGFIDFDFDDGISMEDRMTAARIDASTGKISVSEELEEFAREASFDDLQSIGFKREENPFGRDETARSPLYTLEMKPMECPACGSNFQSRDVSKPGFLPPEKHKYQMKLAKQVAGQKKAESLKEKGEDEWSVDNEIEWLLQNSEGPSDDATKEKHSEETTMADQVDLFQQKKRTICQRCHNLQNFGDIDASLRPGWTDEPLLSQESFRELLKPIREKDAIIIALVDLFDFSGSILPELDSIAGKNPVILAANKADLLPTKMGQLRVENWVRRELEFMRIQSLANIGGAVRLVSCKTGFGISQMLRKVQDLAEERECDVYIVGAANSGKSTLLNRLLQSSEEINGKDKPRRKNRAGNINARKGAVTTSPLPGTTLKFIKVSLDNGRKLYDTPGLLVPGTLTSRLTPAELKMVVPKK